MCRTLAPRRPEPGRAPRWRGRRSCDRAYPFLSRLRLLWAGERSAEAGRSMRPAPLTESCNARTRRSLAQANGVCWHHGARAEARSALEIDVQVQLRELLLIDRRGCAQHQVAPRLRLGERRHFADVFLVRE